MFVMKLMFSIIFLFFSVFSIAQGPAISSAEDVVITSGKSKTRVRTGEKGELTIIVSSKDALKFRADQMVRYSDFGARGDGITDDIDAIAAAHAYANQHGLPVKADDKATYYIGGKNRPAIIPYRHRFRHGMPLSLTIPVLRTVTLMFSLSVPACNRLNPKVYLL
jgi:hypothetical protein